MSETANPPDVLAAYRLLGTGRVWLEQLLGYAEHAPWCRVRGQPCCCGLDFLRKEIDAWLKEYQAVDGAST